MYYMMTVKLNEVNGIKHESGQVLFRVMRNNNINFEAMHEHGLEPYDVPDEIRELGSMYVTPRGG
jgi:hypothetical protein